MGSVNTYLGSQQDQLDQRDLQEDSEVSGPWQNGAPTVIATAPTVIATALLLDLTDRVTAKSVSAISEVS